MNTNILETVEREFKNLFQKDLQFKLNNKVLKEGKLILFSFKEFYLHFKLLVKPNNYKQFEIPYPFSYKVEPSQIVFDYTNNSFRKNNKEIDFLLKLLKKNKHSKFYDNTLIISYS